MRLETERLVIRPWEPRDTEPYASFMADPVVRRFYLRTLTREETEREIAEYIEVYEANGFGFLAVERKSDGALIGDIGIEPVKMALRGNPPVEIGYLFGQQYWGQGYAPEAGRAWLAHAFDVLDLPEVVAFTSAINLPSRRVMEKLGMTRDLLGDFDSSWEPEGHPLRPHVLYRIANPSHLGANNNHRVIPAKAGNSV